MNKLEVMIHNNDESKVKQHSQIFLGSFDESSINLYEELDKLKLMLTKAKQRAIEQKMRESETNWSNQMNAEKSVE